MDPRRRSIKGSGNIFRAKYFTIAMLFTSALLLVISSLGAFSRISPTYIQVPCSSSIKCFFTKAGSDRRLAGDYIYITDKYGQTRRTTAFNSQALLNPCSSSCGRYAECSAIGDRPVCSCPRGFSGDPLNFCKRVECLDNIQCSNHQICKAEKCVDPCEGACGLYAKCEARDHLAVCSCPAGFTGNPLDGCRRLDARESCYPNPCGANSLCQATNDVVNCECLPGYVRANFGCKHECETDFECAPQLACVDFKCQNPCLNCGLNAECRSVVEHRAVCHCPQGHVGNPLVACRPECTSNSECPPGKPACYRNSCTNPCDEPICGFADKCQIRRNATGDIFVECVKPDLCQPNPCGLNAQCQPGHDRFNEPRPLCTCLPGYIGDPLAGCVKAECTEDDHCTNDKACIDYKCQNPCATTQCGNNAQCIAIRHCGICTCPFGYRGNPLINCFLDVCDSVC